MRNTLKFGEYSAVVSYDPDIVMFRGEFVGMNGGADFYASSIEELQKEGEISLRVFLDFAKEKHVAQKEEI